MKQNAKTDIRGAGAPRFTLIAALCLGGLLSLPAWSQKFPNLPISPAQKATADKVSQAGVPLSELVPNAPDTYVVKSRDTLWGISTMYLRSPWRWPELWGMNLQEIHNPHLIFPGQTLYLDKRDGRARLTGTPPAAVPATEGETPVSSNEAAAVSLGRDPQTGLETVRLSPRVRYSDAKVALTTLRTRDIEAFLAEPLIIEAGEFDLAPRLVAAAENHVIIGRGDRVYARGPAGYPMLDDQDKYKQYRIYRNAKPLQDPGTGELLGYEAEFLGKAVLARGESEVEQEVPGGRSQFVPVPATVDITLAKGEILVGDRLAPESQREYLNFAPRAPQTDIEARVVSIYGSSSVASAGQNYVVAISRGRQDGLESGHVLALVKDGRTLADRTDEKRAQIKLPNERNGLLMVFRVFDRLSYGLVLDVTDTVRVGDRLITPR